MGDIFRQPRCVLGWLGPGVIILTAHVFNLLKHLCSVAEDYGIHRNRITVADFLVKETRGIYRVLLRRTLNDGQFVVTSEGLVGFAPAIAQRLDRIAWFAGSSVPFVVRARGELDQRASRLQHHW